jgi:L-fuculose-phosphate aldolase
MEEIVAVGRILTERGMIAGSGGNISLRLDSDRILITPAGAFKGRLTGDELVVISPDGRLLEGNGKPSSEMLMHLTVYRERPDILACIHAHPPYATAFAVVGRELDHTVLPEIALLVGPIPLTDYAPPGTDAVPQALAPYVKSHDAFLLRNHGLLTIGDSIETALNRFEMVEHLAQVLSIAAPLGRIQQIPPGELNRLTTHRQTNRLP